MLISGITSEVAGMISATININTVMARRLVITSVMRSPESGGRKNDNSVRAKYKEKNCPVTHTVGFVHVNCIINVFVEHFRIKINDMKRERRFDDSMPSLSSSKYTIQLNKY